jgi:glycine/D-amino acid oxidase-like deaminating enzyme
LTYVVCSSLRVPLVLTLGHSYLGWGHGTGLGHLVEDLLLDLNLVVVAVHHAGK